MLVAGRVAVLLATAVAVTAAANARGFGSGGGGLRDRSECGGGIHSLSYTPESTVQWSVTSDGCELNLRAGAENSALWAITIISRPQHGTAGVFSRYSLAYKPSAGFVGSDSFSFAVIGRLGTSGEKMIVHVNVTVTP